MPRTGRPREFDGDAVLDIAADVFWTGGYGRTSMQEVIEATGVKRQSLYGAFGDKESLFFRALKRYTQGSREIEAALAGPGPVLPALRAVLRSTLLVAQERPGRGCMLGNTVAELVPAHERATEAARDAYAELRRIFTDALQRGRSSGEIRRDQPVADQASTLLATMQGLRLVSRAELEPRRLLGTVDVLLTGLEDRGR